MNSSKEYFIKLPIRKQVVIGLFVINIWICLLSLLFIVISSYLVIFELGYGLNRIMLEAEDNSLEVLNLYMETEVSNVIDSSMIYTNWSRDLLENYIKFKDFAGIVNLDSKQLQFHLISTDDFLSKIISNDDRTINDKIIYTEYNEADRSSNDYFHYIKCLLAIKTMVSRFNDFRFHLAPNSKITDSFVIYSVKYRQVFAYRIGNYSEMTSNVLKARQTEVDFIYSMYDVRRKFADEVLNYNFTETISRFVLNNPLFFPLNRTTVSLKLNSEIQPILSKVNLVSKKLNYTEFVSTFKDINQSDVVITEDMIMNSWESNIVDLIDIVAVSNFVDFFSVITHTSNNLLTLQGCYKLIRIYDLSANSNEGLNMVKANPSSISTLTDCFMLNQTAQSLKDIYDVDYGYVRKAFLRYSNPFNLTCCGSATNKSLTLNTLVGGIGKFFRFNLFDDSYKLSKSSYFRMHEHFYHYVIRDINYIVFSNSLIYRRSSGFFQMTIGQSILIWYTQFLIAGIVIFRLSKNITMPFDLIILQIENIGREGDELQKVSSSEIESIENINPLQYDFDSDIEDFFKICNSMIMGGIHLKEDNSFQKLGVSKVDEASRRKPNYLFNEELIETLNSINFAEVFNFERDSLKKDETQPEEVRNRKDQFSLLRNKILKNSSFLLNLNSQFESKFIRTIDVSKLCSVVEYVELCHQTGKLVSKILMDFFKDKRLRKIRL